MALDNMIEIAEKFLIITVPSRPDNNPEHVQFFSKQYMSELLSLRKLKYQIEYVGNSMLVIINLQ
jgi:hypothetical protein